MSGILFYYTPSPLPTVPPLHSPEGTNKIIDAVLLSQYMFTLGTTPASSDQNCRVRTDLHKKYEED